VFDILPKYRIFTDWEESLVPINEPGAGAAAPIACIWPGKQNHAHPSTAPNLHKFNGWLDAIFIYTSSLQILIFLLNI
jgi:hypothetical protein